MPNQYSPRISAVDRFWAKVEITEGCWLWKGGCSRKGYGTFRPEPTRCVIAPRWAYEQFVGPIPDGMVVCHNCPDGDNPRCVRPDHLWLGTVADNQRDMAAKGRSQQGSRHWHARLTEQQVLQIRERHARGERVRFLSRVYHVHHGTISDIISRRAWRHI